MKLNHSDLLAFSNEFNEKVTSINSICQIQKLWSTPHYICLCLRIPGRNYYLYLGRGGAFQGAFFWHGPPPSIFRIKDQYLEFLRKKLKNAFIRSCIVDKEDRILELSYYKEKNENAIFFFWRGPRLYFASENKKEFFLSWSQEKVDKLKNDLEGFDIFNGIGRKKTMALPRARAIKKVDLQDYYDHFFDRYYKKKSINRKERYYRNKIRKISEDILKVQNWKKIEKDILDQNYTFPREKNPRLYNIKISLELEWNHYKKVSFTFEKIKKLKKAEKILCLRKEKTELEFFKWQKTKTLNISGVKITYPYWGEEERPIGDKSLEKNIIHYKYKSKIEWALGKNAKGNDFLRNNWGNKEDWWFHIDGLKSSHCVVKNLESVENFLSSLFLILMASALRDQSHYDMEEIPIVFTQLKNVKGLKGRAGAVLIKKEKHIRIDYNKDWRELLEA